MSSRVAVVKGKTRYDAVKKALEYIKDDVAKDVSGKNSLIIKPNLVSAHVQLAVTHVDTVRAIIDFIRQYYGEKILVAEGSASDTITAYRNFGYTKLAKEQGIELFDLNQDNYMEIMVYNDRYDQIPVKVAKKVLESDYRISAAVLKTHDTVIATLSIKNMVVGSIIRYDKHRIHQGYKAINLNIYKIAKHVWPNLAIIDGYTAMEGNGPVSGTPVEMGTVIASTDPLAADTVGAYIMGFDPDDIGYLHYIKRAGMGEGDMDKIEVVGENVENVRRKFRPHSTHTSQRMWRIGEEILNKILRENERIL
ncbi:MAG: DUF362 domain-containing protein [Nitrososphaeria archaeon]|nr:DUF362 domain-containing protein [Nitrososphaeria archaeon]